MKNEGVDTLILAGKHSEYGQVDEMYCKAYTGIWAECAWPPLDMHFLRTSIVWKNRLVTLLAHALLSTTTI